MLPDYSYEAPRRMVSSLAASVDYAALRPPGLRSLAGSAVIPGRV